MQKYTMDHKNEMDVTMVKEAVCGYFVRAAINTGLPFDITAALYLELECLVEEITISQSAEMYREQVGEGSTFRELLLARIAEVSEEMGL